MSSFRIIYRYHMQYLKSKKNAKNIYVYLWKNLHFRDRMKRLRPRNGFAPLRFYTPFPHLPLRRPQNSACKHQSSVIACYLLKHRGLFDLVLRHPRPSDLAGFPRGRFGKAKSSKVASAIPGSFLVKAKLRRIDRTSNITETEMHHFVY